MEIGEHTLHLRDPRGPPEPPPPRPGPAEVPLLLHRLGGKFPRRLRASGGWMALGRRRRFRDRIPQGGLAPAPKQRARIAARFLVQWRSLWDQLAAGLAVPEHLQREGRTPRSICTAFNDGFGCPPFLYGPPVGACLLGGRHVMCCPCPPGGRGEGAAHYGAGTGGCAHTVPEAGKNRELGK